MQSCIFVATAGNITTAGNIATVGNIAKAKSCIKAGLETTQLKYISIERMRVWWYLFGSLGKDKGAENLRKFQNSFLRWLHSLMKLGLHSQFWSIAEEGHCYYLWVPFGLIIIEHLQFLDCISVFAAKMFTLSFSRNIVLCISQLFTLGLHCFDFWAIALEITICNTRRLYILGISQDPWSIFMTKRWCVSN